MRHMPELTEDGKYTKFTGTETVPPYGGPLPWQSYRFCVECGVMLASTFTEIHTNWHNKLKGDK